MQVAETNTHHLEERTVTRGHEMGFTASVWEPTLLGCPVLLLLLQFLGNVTRPREGRFLDEAPFLSVSNGRSFPKVNLYLLPSEGKG